MSLNGAQSVPTRPGVITFCSLVLGRWGRGCTGRWVGDILAAGSDFVKLSAMLWLKVTRLR